MKHLILALSLFLLTSCDVVELVSSADSILSPTPENSTAQSSPPLQEATQSPSQAGSSSSPHSKIEIRSVTQVQPLGKTWNMASQAQLTVHSEMPKHTKERLIDQNLNTSWFASEPGSSGQNQFGKIELNYSDPIDLLGLNLRGNREEHPGLNIEEMTLLIVGKEGVLINETLNLSGKNDVDLLFKSPLSEITSIRILVTRHSAPVLGLAEIEVLGKR